MSGWKHGLAVALLTPLGHASAQAAPALSLDGYTGPNGAITVLHGGDSADPYFAMQALLLAHDNGLDTAAPAEKFIDWLLPKQKPDGTFDRFCKQANGDWLACKTADADDSLLAMWMMLLDTLPAQRDSRPAWQKSYRVATASLDHLYQPSRGVYMVSPIVLHGLFMDNLEVWSLKANHPQASERADAERLAKGIHSTFWNAVDQRYLVSTQLEQRSQSAAFYPDQVAQVFPLLVDFPLQHIHARKHYTQWMAAHRAEWLAQGRTDYPWGLIAVLAVKQRDDASAACWLRESQSMRHSARWAVTDEASLQIVLARGVKAASPQADCR